MLYGDGDSDGDGSDGQRMMDAGDNDGYWLMSADERMGRPTTLEASHKHRILPRRYSPKEPSPSKFRPSISQLLREISVTTISTTRRLHSMSADSLGMDMAFCDTRCVRVRNYGQLLP